MKERPDTALLRGFSRFEWALLVAFAAIVYFQLFVTPNIGLANNGDYQKMIGRFWLGPMGWHNEDEQLFYEQRWRYDAAYHWVSDNYSSELIWIGAAVGLSRLFSHEVFDLRVLGAIHALLWAGCFMTALPLFRGLRGWPRYVIPLLALCIFTDASYVVYLNSLHTDTSAFIFVCWSVVIALRIAARPSNRWWPYSALLIASLLFITAKPQHSLLGLLWCVVVFALAPGSFGRGLALLAIPIAVVLTLISVPPAERQLEISSSIFAKLLPRSADPENDLRALGMPVEMKSWIGSYGDQALNNPLKNAQVLAVLTPAADRSLALFYLEHPTRAFEIINSDLGWPAVHRRPPFLGNYQRKNGFERRTLARSFHCWSDLRSEAFRLARWHVWVWYAAFMAIAAWRLGRTKSKAPLIALVLGAMGLLALASASLGEIGETDRHLWLFHVMTDLTLVIGAVWCGEHSRWVQARTLS